MEISCLLTFETHEVGHSKPNKVKVTSLSMWLIWRSAQLQLEWNLEPNLDSLVINFHFQNGNRTPCAQSVPNQKTATIHSPKPRPPPTERTKLVVSRTCEVAHSKPYKINATSFGNIVNLTVSNTLIGVKLIFTKISRVLASKKPKAAHSKPYKMRFSFYWYHQSDG